MNTLAERLKTARLLKGDVWTQAHLAAASAVSTGTIGNIESGLRGVKRPIGTLPQIAKALGVSYEWLAHGEGEMLESAVAVKVGGAKTQRTTPLGPDVEKKMERLLLTLYQVPPESRLEALTAAIEVLIDRLPQPPN